MDIKELKQYWLDLSDYDFVTAHAMFDTKRYLYVGFMAHQSVEKALKAYFVFKIAKEAPYTHDLWRLSEASGLKEMLSEDYCRRLLNKTAEVQSWIKQMC